MPAVRMAVAILNEIDVEDGMAGCVVRTESKSGG